MNTDAITCLSVIIFAIHQVETFIKIDPFTDVKKIPVFRAESLVQLYTFIVTIGTFLPLECYLPPVLVIYAGVNYLVYNYAE